MTKEEIAEIVKVTTAEVLAKRTKSLMRSSTLVITM